MVTPFNKPEAVKIYTEKTTLFPVERVLFNKYLIVPGDILDLGCGTGRTTRPLKDMGHIVIGVDIAPNMIEQAKALHPDIEFHVGDAAELEFSDESFDYVLFSYNSIDYLYPESRRLVALKEFHRVVKPGEWVVIKVPNKPITFESPNHLYSWSQTSFTNFLELVFPKVKVVCNTRMGRPEKNCLYRIFETVKRPNMKYTLQRMYSVVFNSQLVAYCQT